MDILKGHIADGLAWARTCTLDLLMDFPEERYCFRSGKADCHALWILGHIALSDEWILKMFDMPDRTIPDGYGKLFGYQSEMLDDRDAYPPLEEVRHHFDRSRARLLERLSGFSDAGLLESLDDGGADFANTPAEAFAKESWHEGWHAGQLSTLRRAIGLVPAFG